MGFGRFRWLLAAFCGAVLLSGGCGPRERAPKPIDRLTGLTIRFLDIGQGDAALLQWAGRSALIDGGPEDPDDRLLDALRRYNVKKLDWVIASHPHADHIGGLIDVLRNVPVDHFLDSGYNAGSPVQERLLTEIKRHKMDFRIAQEGHTVDLGAGLAILLFAPPDPFLENTESDVNNNSLAGRLMYGKVRVLFTGDVETQGRQVMYSHLPVRSEGPRALRADVLKVSHHGSHNGTDPEFLQYVQPKQAVISCGRRNRYGHPHREALQALKQAGVSLYRTDLQGDITLQTDGNTITMSPQHAATRDVWSPGSSRSQRSRSTAR